MDHPLSPSTRRSLQVAALAAQRASRTPALVAGVARAGTLLWDTAIGSADLSDPTVPLGADTQFLIASNTKTFTAAMVMQLRDEGRLRLEDPIDLHLPDCARPLTVRDLLAHASGLQREPVGDMWDTLGRLNLEDPVANVNVAEAVLAPRRLWHYSNLAYMLLGSLIARLDGRSWSDSLTERLLDPLGLRRTTTTLVPPHAGLYYVPAFTDVPVPEPLVFTGPTLPAGGLASTLADLVAWHAFLLSPDAAVLSPDSVEEMLAPQLPVDPGGQVAYGLGVFLHRRDGETWFGHTGAAPGGISGVFSHAGSKTTSVLLTNQSAARDPAGTALDLGVRVLAEHPPLPEPWQPGTERPAELAGVLGLWFSEGSPGVFSVAQGQLEFRPGEAHPGEEPTRFAREGEDVYRSVRGLERGERLLIHRRPDGSVWQLNWATYRFTREPLGFAEPNPDAP
ncbi:serine hydrolase [Conexibacter sp. DBS9H8]|uniref:serine hydrolase domain-containing protein n=1 Tax=Conexibacter sp. DBS9H8 TaxID=2937801 RepID=UPI00200F99BF|nr:serine hydrolase domain-containing protein [Conexibacter sp. DBS9H8]